MFLPHAEQPRDGESQFAAAEVQYLLASTLHCALDGGFDSITDLFAVPMPLYQSGIPQNAKVVRYMRLRTAENFREIRDTFFAHQE